MTLRYNRHLQLQSICKRSPSAHYCTFSVSLCLQWTPGKFVTLSLCWLLWSWKFIGCSGKWKIVPNHTSMVYLSLADLWLSFLARHCQAVSASEALLAGGRRAAQRLHSTFRPHIIQTGHFCPTGCVEVSSYVLWNSTPDKHPLSMTNTRDLYMISSHSPNMKSTFTSYYYELFQGWAPLGPHCSINKILIFPTKNPVWIPGGGRVVSPASSFTCSGVTCSHSIDWLPCAPLNITRL